MTHDQPIHQEPARRPVVDRPYADGAFRSTQTYLQPMREFDDLKPYRPRRWWRLCEAAELVQWAVVLAAAGYLMGRLWPLLLAMAAQAVAGMRP